MFFKILGLISLSLITIFLGNKEKLTHESLKTVKKKIVKCNELNYEDLNYIENLDFKDFNFQVYFDNERRWKKSLLNDHVQSYKNNKNIVNQDLRLYNISERHNGSIEIQTQKISCYLKARIRPHGNLSDHRTGNLPSLNINLKEGNIKGITRFLLLKPKTRGYNNEVFNSVLLKQIGFLAPITFNTKVFYNNEKFDLIFQEKIVKEMLERFDLRESFIAELDERFFWHDPLDAKEFSKFGVANSKLVLKNQKNQIIAEYATSLLNDLDRIHYRLDEILIDYSTLSKALEKEYFDRLEIFDAILYSVYAGHGLEIDDRKFYFNPFSRKFLPIFYDAGGGLLTKKNKLSNLNIESYNQKFLPSAKKGSSLALQTISSLNLENLRTELSKMGMFFNNKDLSKIIDRIKFNLLYLSKLSENKLFKISINKQKEIIDSNNQSYNKNINRNFVYYSNNFDHFISCEFQKKNCRDFKINISDKSELLRQNLSYDKKHFIYLGQNLMGTSSENFFYRNFDKFTEKNFEVKNINDEIKIFFNKKVNIEIFQDKKEIYITNYDQERVVFFDSNLNEWSIKYSRDLSETYNSKKSNFVSSDEFGLTGCLTFLNSKVNNLNLKLENMKCEDSVNFIKTNGHINKIVVYNSAFDSIDADFSSIIFKELNIKNSGNDCLDFSYGEYVIQNANLAHCKDKAISAGEKSLLKINKVKIDNSDIGIASKDSSKVLVENTRMNEVRNCLSSYKKKQEFWGGYIFANNINCSKFNKFENKDKYSKIIIKNSNLANKVILE